MRQLKEIHPEYSESVDFLAVNVDPSESADKLLGYKQSEGFVWPMTTADTNMLRNYNVTRQAGHMTLYDTGIIATSISYDSPTADGWRELFEALITS